MSRTRPATVRYYFDADVRGLGKLVAQVRPDSTYPGDPGGEVHKQRRPPCIVHDTATLDDDWIPMVAAQGWLIITRDSRIQDHRLEIEAVRSSAARRITLAPKDAIGTWSQLLLVARVWHHIEALNDRPGPFIYNANPSGLSAVKLD